jgi:hypothetical protein
MCNAAPGCLIRRTTRPVLATALASRPESVGYFTFAGTTVVSAPTFPVFTTRASTAVASNYSLSAATTESPHRVVIFISVVGCGTRPSMSMRQNRRHDIESDSSAHSDSYPSW